MHWFSRNLATLIAQCVLVSVAFAGGDPPPATNVLYGFYFSDFTLTAVAPGPDYFVIGDVFVQPGVTMTIDPGVTVYFAANHDTLNGGDYFNDSEIILDDADMVAVGSEGEPIRFTSLATAPNRGDWGQIRLNTGAQGVFEHVVIEFATKGLTLGSCGPVSVLNSVIQDCGSDGIGGTAESLTLNDGTIRRCGGRGVNASNIPMGAIRRNSIANTSGVGIYLSACAFSPQWNTVSQSGQAGIQIAGAWVPGLIIGDTVTSVIGDGLVIAASGSQDSVLYCHAGDCIGAGIRASASLSTSRVVIMNCASVHNRPGIYACQGQGSSSLLYTTTCEVPAE